MDLEYSSQQARRYLGWQNDVVGSAPGVGSPAADAIDIENLFFEHPLYGFGAAGPPKPNGLWEDSDTSTQENLPATLGFSNQAITLQGAGQAANNSAVVDAGTNPVFNNSPFGQNATYNNPTVTVNLDQVPYLIADEIADTNPFLLDQTNDSRFSPSSSGGVITETLLPEDEEELTDTIGPTPSNATIAATEFWLTAAGNFTQAINGVGIALTVRVSFLTFGFNLALPTYPFDELVTVPRENFFDIKAPNQSVILPPNRIDIPAQ